MLLLVSCNKQKNPKEKIKDFVLTVKKLDFENAKHLLTTESQNVFDNFKTKFQNSYEYEKELKKSKTIKDNEIINNYNLNSLTELVSGNNAIVYSNDSIRQISVEKVNDEWKIVCKEEFLSDIFSKTEINRFDKRIEEMIKNYCAREYFLNRIIDTATNLESKKIREKEKEIIKVFGKKDYIIRVDYDRSTSFSVSCYLNIDSSNIIKFSDLQNDLTDLFQDYWRTRPVSDYLLKKVIQLELDIENEKEYFNLFYKNNQFGFQERIRFKQFMLNDKIRSRKIFFENLVNDLEIPRVNF